MSLKHHFENVFSTAAFATNSLTETKNKQPNVVESDKIKTRRETIAKIVTDKSMDMNISELMAEDGNLYYHISLLKEVYSHLIPQADTKLKEAKIEFPDTVPYHMRWQYTYLINDIKTEMEKKKKAENKQSNLNTGGFANTKRTAAAFNTNHFKEGIDMLNKVESILKFNKEATRELDTFNAFSRANASKGHLISNEILNVYAMFSRKEKLEWLGEHKDLKLCTRDITLGNYIARIQDFHSEFDTAIKEASSLGDIMTFMNVCKNKAEEMKTSHGHSQIYDLVENNLSPPESTHICDIINQFVISVLSIAIRDVQENANEYRLCIDELLKKIPHLETILKEEDQMSNSKNEALYTNLIKFCKFVDSDQEKTITQLYKLNDNFLKSLLGLEDDIGQNITDAGIEMLSSLEAKIKEGLDSDMDDDDYYNMKMTEKFRFIFTIPFETMVQDFIDADVNEYILQTIENISPFVQNAINSEGTDDISMLVQTANDFEGGEEEEEEEEEEGERKTRRRTRNSAKTTKNRKRPNEKNISTGSKRNRRTQQNQEEEEEEDEDDYRLSKEERALLEMIGNEATEKEKQVQLYMKDLRDMLILPSEDELIEKIDTVELQKNNVAFQDWFLRVTYVTCGKMLEKFKFEEKVNSPMMTISKFHADLNVRIVQYIEDIPSLYKLLDVHENNMYPLRDYRNPVFKYLQNYTLERFGKIFKLDEEPPQYICNRYNVATYSEFIDEFIKTLFQ